MVSIPIFISIIVPAISVVTALNPVFATAEHIKAVVYGVVSLKGIDKNLCYWYSVYAIVDNDKKADENIVYIGMTNCPVRRLTEHRNSDRFKHSNIDMFVLITGLEKHIARVIEQTIISAFTLNALKNLINSIAAGKRVAEEFERVGNWFDCLAEEGLNDLGPWPW